MLLNMLRCGICNVVLSSLCSLYLYLYIIKRSKKQQENSLMIEIWAPVSLVLGSGTILLSFICIWYHTYSGLYGCVSSVSGLWDQVTWPRRRPHQFIRNTLPHMQPASAVRAEHRNRVSWSRGSIEEERALAKYHTFHNPVLLSKKGSLI